MRRWQPLRSGKRRSVLSCRVLLLLFLGSLLDPSAGGASILQDPPVAVRRERPRFVMDAGAFWKGETAWVAVDVGVPYRDLMFRLDRDTYRAAFDLIVVVYERDRQLTGDLWTEVVTTKSYAETRGSDKSFRRTVTLPVRPGRLRVEVTVSEQDSGNEGRLEQEIQVPALEKEPLYIGKIWFADCPPDSTGPGAQHPPEPILLRRFGTGGGAVCAWAIFSTAASVADEPIEGHWSVRAQQGPVVAEGDLVGLQSGETCSVVLPIRKLWLGRYELMLRARAGKWEAARVTGFEMDESTVSLHQSPSESIALVRYIAEGAEIEELEDAAPEDRAKVWETFWKRRDPTPETEENEFKTEFFRRVRYANENYGGAGPGWKSDRGMIYIRHGQPDLIESYPHNLEGPPYEIWIYHSLGRRFVFVDYDGFGHYELQTPGRR